MNTATLSERAESLFMRRLYASQILLELVLLCGFIMSQVASKVRS